MFIFRVLLDRELSTYPGLMEFCQQLYNDRYRSPYLIACMIDAYEEMLENNNGDQEETLKKSVQVYYVVFFIVKTKNFKFYHCYTYKKSFGEFLMEITKKILIVDKQV